MLNELAKEHTLPLLQPTQDDKAFTYIIYHSSGGIFVALVNTLSLSRIPVLARLFLSTPPVLQILFDPNL
jgi:hypothetical protein